MQPASNRQESKEVFRIPASELLRGRRGRTGKYVFAVRQRDFSCITGLRAVFGQVAVDGDLLTLLQGILCPAVADQRIGRATFTLPVLRFALGIFHIEINPDVGIEPFNFSHRTRQRDGRLVIELGAEGMVRDGWKRDGNQSEQTGCTYS